MWQRLIYGILVATLMTPSVPAQDTKRTEAHKEAIQVVDAWLDSVQAYQHIPAISVAIVVGDDTVWAKGYGTIDPQHTVPASPSTIYSICSISKLFTAVALMQQYEMGRVQLDAPITTYLPWASLQPSSEGNEPVTLRAVLSHSAGLPRESPYPYWSEPDYIFPTTEQIRQAIASQQMLYPVGTYAQYSNLGFALLGQTVEAVSGQPYALYVGQHVLAPLKMKDTQPFLPVDLYGKRLAVGYDALRRDGSRALLKPFDTRGMAPAAGYTSTVLDMASFASWQFRLLRDGQGTVLKRTTLREMQRVQFVDPGWKEFWGLGFSVSRLGDKTYVGHDGGCPGYNTGLRLRVADETAVVFMDDTADVADPYLAGVFAILDKRKGFPSQELASGSTDLKAFVGYYSNQPWGAEGVMLPWAGGLVYLALPAADPASQMSFLKAEGKDVFRVIREDGSEAEAYTFKRNESGKVIGFEHFSNLHERLAQ